MDNNDKRAKGARGLIRSATNMRKRTESQLKLDWVRETLSARPEEQRETQMDVKERAGGHELRKQEEAGCWKRSTGEGTQDRKGLGTRAEPGRVRTCAHSHAIQ